MHHGLHCFYVTMRTEHTDPWTFVVAKLVTICEEILFSLRQRPSLTDLLHWIPVLWQWRGKAGKSRSINKSHEYSLVGPDCECVHIAHAKCELTTSSSMSDQVKSLLNYMTRNQRRKPNKPIASCADQRTWVFRLFQWGNFNHVKRKGD